MNTSIGDQNEYKHWRGEDPVVINRYRLNASIILTKNASPKKQTLQSRNSNSTAGATWLLSSVPRLHLRQGHRSAQWGLRAAISSFVSNRTTSTWRSRLAATRCSSSRSTPWASALGCGLVGSIVPYVISRDWCSH